METSRSEVGDRGITVTEHAGDCLVDGKPQFPTSAASLMSKSSRQYSKSESSAESRSQTELEAEMEAGPEPMPLDAIMFPKRRAATQVWLEGL